MNDKGPVRCQQRPVEAMQYDGTNYAAIAAWAAGHGATSTWTEDGIRAGGFSGLARLGDWIISGRWGFTYVTHVCFENHYDVLPEAVSADA